MGSIISDLWSSIQLSTALTEIVSGVADQVTSLLPIGVALIGIMAVPRIIKRVIHTFL